MVDYRNVLFKSIGTVSAGVLLWGAYKNGQRHKNMSVKEDEGTFLANKYMDLEKMSNGSDITNAAKKKYFKKMLDMDVVPVWSAIKGFTGGVVNSLADNVIPLALTVGTLASKHTAPYCVVGLGLYVLKHLLYDVMCLGKPNMFHD